MNDLLRIFFLLLFAFLAGCEGRKDKPVNLLVVVVDTLRSDHVGCYGYERKTTPVIDTLAEDGIVFEESISQAAFTLPSMATLFTSLNPMRHNVRKHPDEQGGTDGLDPDVETLPKALKTAGYRTGAVVSNALFRKRFRSGFRTGFDFFNVGLRRRDAGSTTDVAIRWLDENSGPDKPFFLWVHYIDPHWPYNAPPESQKPFHHEDKGEFWSLLQGFHDKSLPRDRIYFDCPLGPDGVASGICEYDNEIAYADAQMGRLLGRMKEKGLDEKTLIAVVSDHGEALGEHGLTFTHSFYLYDEIQKVVMILRPPGGCRPVRIKKQVRLLDFTPTVLDMLGLDPLEEYEGRSLTPLWTKGEQALPDLPAYAESEPRYPRGGTFRYPMRKRAHKTGNAGKWRMVRHKGYKLIWIPGEGWELYSLNKDPAELHDLSSAPPREAGPLADILERYMEEEAETSPSRECGLDDDTLGELEKVLESLGY